MTKGCSDHAEVSLRRAADEGSLWTEAGSKALCKDLIAITARERKSFPSGLLNQPTPDELGDVPESFEGDLLVESRTLFPVEGLFLFEIRDPVFLRGEGFRLEEEIPES